MKGATVSIDRIVIDFTDVYWDFFNEFHKRNCHYYGVRMTVGDRGFQYRIRINTGEHFLHLSYKLVYAPKTRKNTLRTFNPRKIRMKVSPYRLYTQKCLIIITL